MNLLPHWFCFAYVPGWYGRLEELAELARLEPWRFRESVYSTKNLDTPIFREIHTCNLKKQAIDYNEEKESEKSAQYFHVESEYACFHTRLYLNACLLARPVIPWLAVIFI